VQITFVKRQAGSDQFFKFPVKEDIDLICNLIFTYDVSVRACNMVQFGRLSFSSITVLKYNCFSLFLKAKILSILPHREGNIDIILTLYGVSMIPQSAG